MTIFVYNLDKKESLLYLRNFIGNNLLFKINSLSISQFWYKNCFFNSMKVDLTELTSLEGVIDSFVFKKGGELLIPRLPYTDERIEHMGREVALCSALLEKIKQEVNFFELVYEDRHVIVQIAHNFLTMVVCENTADTTLIKLRLNVIHEGVKTDNDLQKTLRKSPEKESLLAEAKDDSELQRLFNMMQINV